MELSNDVGRNLLVERSQEITVRRTPWRHWPLWRLLGVLAMFGAIAYVQFGVRPHHLRQLPLGVATVIEVALALSLLSGLLGAFVVNVYLLWPLAFLTKANNRFFDVGEAIAARLAPSGQARFRWLVAYAIELSLFLAVFYGGRWLLLRAGARL